MSQESVSKAIETLRRVISEVKCDEIEPRLGKIFVIDIREAQELAGGVIPGANFFEKNFLEQHVFENVPDRSTEIVLYCESGNRSVFSCKALTDLGYSNVSSLVGGFRAWKHGGYTINRIEASLTDHEKSRYAKQIILPQIGLVGQKILKQSRVVVIGAGGLGAPCLLYLAAAGVGTVCIIDDDQVDISNLQRQILYKPADIGRFKVDAAADFLLAFNPDINVEKIRERFSRETDRSLFSGAKIVIDCTDNFESRYAINDLAVSIGVPLVHGAVFQYEGTVAVLCKSDGPCYRCVFPEPPPSAIAPSCAEAGVLGALTGIVGAMQAAEALKYLLDVGRDVHWMYFYDGLSINSQAKRLTVRANCDCQQLRAYQYA
ncbi:molybdopterin biosynthesis protein MoeB [Pseudomonas amygdali pv. eriobotryae]|uniref:Molybdopterin-synthase adenylyltransferase n=1 Tax=Pseudomonas amygdali pv. eriobotryae TaxID=129137 RepID=A0A9P3AKR5_PSEA0|nr:ThiF family adenylyltransferase [Pseudomonas amygdali]GFZ63210.1 molybdopterin biosynthesis protein MoeB [Pseudomonas amygdali pv. eriobotryae]GFZ74832.1 molybdopterin biosynthesis protein MoeB [Pseudomonas amygdali pv. eriobotryae]